MFKKGFENALDELYPDTIDLGHSNVHVASHTITIKKQVKYRKWYYDLVNLFDDESMLDLDFPVWRPCMHVPPVEQHGWIIRNKDFIILEKVK